MIQAGLFGKLPARGDFVRLGLPRDFVEPWDSWLQEGLLESRAQLGAGWIDVFLVAPVWRFALAPGMCGACGVLGVLLPSVDKAGRYFPLTLAASGDGAGEADLAEAAPFLDALEEAGLAALEDASPDFVQAAVQAALPDLAWPVLMPGVTLWWTEACRRQVPGMPAAGDFAEMLKK